MLSYEALRNAHVGAVIVSIGLFALRGAWMLAESPLLGTRAARVLPHVVDTVLLAAGVGLAVVSHQYPFAQPWLTAKIAGLVLYVVLGSIALRRGRSRRLRILALAGALAVVAWIVATARCRCVWP
jgi:uncharacterized membrane protein SirB2